MQVLGPVNGIGAWLAPTLRRKKANEKLQGFINRHPEYQQLSPFHVIYQHGRDRGLTLAKAAVEGGMGDVR